jgi:large subunit ribosomal protein L24
MKIKKGDSIIVRTGKDRGKTGTVTRVFAKTEQVLVDGINVAKHHQRSRRRGSQGQIVERPMPLHISNVAIVDKKTGKAARVGYIFEGEGDKKKKVRVTRPSGEKI